MILLAVAGLFLGPPGRATEPRLSRPPEGMGPWAPALPPAAEDDVRQLRKAAEAMRQKADDMRAKSEDLRDRNQYDQADELDERAQRLYQRAFQFEDEADEIVRTAGRRTGPRTADSH